MGRLEHGEALVMFGGDDDPFHSGSLGHPHNLTRVKQARVELLGQCHVVGGGYAHLVFDPFANAVKCLVMPLPAEMGVQPPVDEHPVIAIAEQGRPFRVFHAGLHRALAPHFVHGFLGTGQGGTYCKDGQQAVDVFHDGSLSGFSFR